MPIHEIIIAVGDLDRGITFYTDVCGFSFVRTVPSPAGRVVELDAAGQRVTLVEQADAGVHLALSTRDVEAERRRLRRRDVDGVADDTTRTDDGAWLGFTDPWGNRLGFWEPR